MSCAKRTADAVAGHHALHQRGRFRPAHAHHSERRQVWPQAQALGLPALGSHQEAGGG